MNRSLRVAQCLILTLSVISPATAQQSETSLQIEEKIQHARTLQNKGSLPEAKAIYMSLLESLRSKAPSSQLGLVLNGLSQIALADGDYDSAAKDAQQAADAYRASRDQEGEAHALNNKGIAEVQHGEYASAQIDLENALGLSKAAADKENEIQILNNLGSAFYFRGMYSEALANYELARDEVRGSRDKSWARYWQQITNFNEATLYQRLGRYQRALDIYKQVESSSKTLDDSDRGHLFANLGTLYRRLGDPWKALATYRSAADFYKKHKDADGELSVLKNIGIVYVLDLADPGKAEPIFKQALSLAQTTRNRRQEMQVHLYLGETYLGENTAKLAHREFQLALDLANQLNTKEEQWKARYGLGRVDELAGSLHDAESSYREAIAIIESTRAQLQFPNLRAEFLADKRDVYDALIKILLERHDLPEAFSFLERSRARTFQDRLQVGQLGVPTMDQLRSHLDESSLVLDFWTYEDGLALIWFDRNGYGSLQTPLSDGDLKQIRTFLHDLPSSLQGQWRDATAVLERLLPDAGTLLHSAKTKHLVVIPDGWLSFVPFELLRIDRNSNLPLVEQFDISYLPTSVLLLRDQVRRKRILFPWTRELVAFGNPVIPQAGSSKAAEELGAIPMELPYSTEEIRSLAAMVHGRKQLFLGPADLKRDFLGGTANSGFLLHVSTHAFADADNPEDSRLLFSSENANPSPQYVFLRELYDINLSGVSLTTISACDTEKGKVIRGEGVQAFSRALLAAGSDSSLTTLWRVEDEPTAEFMKQFYYFAIEEHLPKAAALRRAKLKFLHSQSALENPRYWAAFVLNGDGLEPLPRVVSWRELATYSAAALILVFLIGRLLWSRRRRYRQHDSRTTVSQQA
jgi:CHAT domain-containing protein